MRIEDAFAACEETVRRHDPDRFYSALFAPAERRPLLFVLYAFNQEIARVAETTREPMMADIRLQWWREAAESARNGRPRAHAAVKGLAELFARTGIPLEMFDALIDAREEDAGAQMFASMKALEDYADATSGGVMRIAARALGVDDTLDGLARAAGIAFALTGLLRAIPFHAARRKLYLPLDLLAQVHLQPDDIFAGRGEQKLKEVMGHVAACARDHLDAARAYGKPKRALASVMPAATVPVYLKYMTKPAFDPFVMRADLPLYRRQLAMLGATLRRHV